MQALSRLVVGLVVALFAVTFGLVLSVPVDAALTRHRVPSLTNAVAPSAGGPDVALYLARPTGEGPFPTVVMLHEFWGLNEELIAKAELLASEGYLVVAPDTFRGGSTSWLPRAIYQSLSTPQARIDEDLDAVHAWLLEHPDVDPARIAVMGFCYGGRAALRYSLHNPTLAATAVFYGRPVTDVERLRQLRGPVLGVFGSADRQIPVSEVRAFDEALSQAGVRHQVSLYEGQGHAFVSSVEAIREGGAPLRAWNELIGFLERTLRRGSPQG
jgi:carboxymethylenebutenolidase